MSISSDFLSLGERPTLAFGIVTSSIQHGPFLWRSTSPCKGGSYHSGSGKVPLICYFVKEGYIAQVLIDLLLKHLLFSLDVMRICSWHHGHYNWYWVKLFCFYHRFSESVIWASGFVCTTLHSLPKEKVFTKCVDGMQSTSGRVVVLVVPQLGVLTASYWLEISSIAGIFENSLLNMSFFSRFICRVLENLKPVVNWPFP